MHHFSTLLSFQVGTNGIISFGSGFYEWNSELFPGLEADVSNVYLAAPFWSDVDISSGFGSIFYEILSAGDDRSEDLLASVSDFITNQTDRQFSGSWMMVAQWNEVPEFSFFGANDQVTTHKYMINGSSTKHCKY